MITPSSRTVPKRRSRPRKTFCAAVDLGATSGRVMLGSWSGGRLELSEVHRFPNAFKSVGDHDYWEIPRLWSEVRRGLLLAQEAAGGRLASVGVDTWGVDYALVDAHGRVVFPIHAYRDRRTEPFIRRLRRESYARIYALTGLPDYPYNSSIQLQETLTSCPAVADVAARCLFLPDYFNFLLSGRMENEISISSHSQLLDVHGTGWSREALAHFGIPADWFSEPLRSPTRLGRVRDIPGLEKVAAIAVPGHDTACAFTAMPAAPDGSDIYLSTGTWSLLGFESDRPVLGDEARALRVSNERMGDGRFRPLRSCLGLWLLERTFASFGTTPRTTKDWKTLLAAAARLPAPARLLDCGDETLFNPADMRRAIDAQLRHHRAKPPTTLPGYVRLVCASLGSAHAASVRAFERLTDRTFKRLLVTGGGSRNALLCQATADASGLPIAAFSLEGSAVGNIASQLVALGAVKDLATLRASLAENLGQRVFTPR